MKTLEFEEGHNRFRIACYRGGDGELYAGVEDHDKDLVDCDSWRRLGENRLKYKTAVTAIEALCRKIEALEAEVSDG